MDTKLFLCVDGGGSKTEALLADTAGRVLGIGAASGSNALSVGKENAAAAVLRAVHEAAGGFPLESIDSAWLFIPGFSSCLPLPLPFETPVLSDSANAYFGALGAPGGIVLLAGTGSFAVSFDSRGTETAVGGWGPMLGDEGSGYDIGRRAVRNTLRDFDLGREPSALGREVLKHYGIGDAKRLVHVLYHADNSREQMARLCLIVGMLAGAGDPDACGILQKAAEALADLAVTLQKRLHLHDTCAALTGGVSGLGSVLTKPLKRALSPAGISLRPALYNPSVGGILYACFRITGRMPSAKEAEAYFEAYKTVKEHVKQC